tara:strand:- start:1848 stop:2381 length:534 start_codon:yes stop_codon:yes gene_type:complete
MPIIFLDTETTGLDPLQGHEIIEIAIITEFNDGTQEIWETKIKPNRLELANPKALEINRYNDKDWVNAIPMSEAIKEIAKRLKKGLLIGYNPYFDWGFIQSAMKEYDISPSYRIRCIDVMVFVHEHLQPKGLKYLSLDAVRDFLGWDKTGNHSAMKDTLDTKKLYYLLKTDYDNDIL